MEVRSHRYRLTKVVDGVRTPVVYDRELHAQDNDGSVWYFGGYREEYEGGELVEPRAWVPDQSGAREGITMLAEPQPGTPSYAQGHQESAPIVVAMNIINVKKKG